MNPTKSEMFTIIPLLTGFLSAVGQIILIRELMIAVKGNEIVFVIILSLWLLFVAVGTLFSKLVTDRITIKVIKSSLIILMIIIPMQVLMIHFLNSQLLLIKGMMIDLPGIFLLSCFILAPGCLLIGFLFPLNCRLHNTHSVYIRESLGMIIGGLFFLIFINFLRNFQLCILGSLLVSVVLLFYSRKTLFILIPLLVLFIFSRNIYLNIYERCFPSGNIVLSEDSRYGRFDVTAIKDQQNYFWDGNLITDSEEEYFAEEIINFILLQHPDPEEILIVGGLLNNYQNEIPDEIKVDHLEIDPNIIAYSKEHFKQDLHIIEEDPTVYFDNSTQKYDIILIDVPDPGSIFLNRFYTIEFFRKIESALKNENSIAVITVSNAANFMPPELSELNSVIYHSFREVFANSIIIPADKVLYIGSENDFISNDETVLIARMKKNGIEKKRFNSALIYDICNQIRKEQFYHSLNRHQKERNIILSPRAYLLSITFRFRQLGVGATGLIDLLKGKKELISGAFVGLMILFSILITSRSSASFSDNFNLVSISMIAFISQMVLVYLLQMFFGFVYYLISLFTLTFMSGLVIGFSLSRKFRIPVIALMIVNLGIFVIMIFLLADLRNLLFVVNIIIAVLEGAIISQILSGSSSGSIGNSASRFYFLDTLGATFGGLLFGILLLPFFHIKNIILFLIIFLTLNIFVQVFRKFWKKEVG